MTEKQEAKQPEVNSPKRIDDMFEEIETGGERCRPFCMIASGMHDLLGQH